MSDATYDAGDEEQVAKKVAAEKLLEQAMAFYRKDVLSTYAGRAVMWEVLGLCGIYNDCMPGDAAHMAHFLGRRQIGLRVLSSLLTVDENLYNTMRVEALDRQRKAEA